MQRASFREQSSKPVGPQTGPLHIVPQPTTVGSQSEAEAGIGKVARHRQAEAQFEEVDLGRPSNPRRRPQLVPSLMDIRDRLSYGGREGNGEDLAIPNDLLLFYVRFVLNFDRGFRKYIANRIVDLKKELPALWSCDTAALKAIALADLRREINDELRSPTETHPVKAELVNRIVYRACHLNGGPRQPYIVSVDPETFAIVDLWLPGKFNRSKQHRRSRQREFRLNKGRRGRKPILVLVKR